MRRIDKFTEVKERIRHNVEGIIFGKLLNRERIAIETHLDKDTKEHFYKDIIKAIPKPGDERTLYQIWYDMTDTELKYGIKHIWRKKEEYKPTWIAPKKEIK